MSSRLPASSRRGWLFPQEGSPFPLPNQPHSCVKFRLPIHPLIGLIVGLIGAVIIPFCAMLRFVIVVFMFNKFGWVLTGVAQLPGLACPHFRFFHYAFGSLEVGWHAKTLHSEAGRGEL